MAYLRQDVGRWWKVACILNYRRVAIADDLAYTLLKACRYLCPSGCGMCVQCEEVFPEDVKTLASGVKRAIQSYGTPAFSKIILNCMALDLSWKVSACGCLFTSSGMIFCLSSFRGGVHGHGR